MRSPTVAALVLCACGSREAPVAPAQPRCPSVTQEHEQDASAIVDAQIAEAAPPTPPPDPKIARDALLSRVASLPLKTIALPPAPPHPPPPPPPHHDLEIRQMAMPRIYESTMRMSDGLPAEVVRRLTRQNFGRFRLCYENALRIDPTRASKVLVRFVIHRNDIIWVEPLASESTPELAACVTHAFEALSFPEPETTLVVVEYGLTFEP